MYNSAIGANMMEMLKYSKIEHNRYKQTGKAVHLQQACEKLFNAFSRYLEIKYNTPTGSHKQLWELASRDSRNEKLFGILGSLHQFFYHGESDERPSLNMEKIYKESYRSVKKRIENLR